MVAYGILTIVQFTRKKCKKDAIDYDKVDILNILIDNDIFTIVSVAIERDVIPRGIIGKYMVKKVDIFTCSAIYTRTGHANQSAAEQDYRIPKSNSDGMEYHRGGGR
jgi:hypothetical protein